MNRTPWRIFLGLTLVAGPSLVTLFGPSRRPELWLTPDQRGDRLLHAGKARDAAKRYDDPARQGTAYFRAGDFKAADAACARDASPEGAYNRGNALVMLGKYDGAVKSYDRALSLRPGWRDAEENRAIAATRRDRMKFSGGDASGGEMKADQ